MTGMKFYQLNSRIKICQITLWKSIHNKGGRFKIQDFFIDFFHLIREINFVAKHKYTTSQ